MKFPKTYSLTYPLKIGWWAVPAILFFYLTGCSSPMTIRTEPPDAKTYVNVKYLGLSPVACNGRGWLWGKREVLVMKKGYKSVLRKVKRVRRKPETTLQKTIFFPAYLGPWYWPEEVFIGLESKREQP